MVTRKSREDRRGVVLLIILGLLAMFAMVALSFVLISGHSRRGARSLQRAAEYPLLPDEELHQAALHVFRGPSTEPSAMGPHSLLEDIYGNRPVSGSILMVPSGSTDPPESPTAICGGQLIEFTTSLPLDEARRRVGCVLTMREGHARGRSTRIVAYREVRGALSGLTYPRFQILAFPGVASSQVVGFNYAADPFPDYLINGTPFSGTGFGYDASSSSGMLDAELVVSPSDPILALRAGGVSLPEALLPNRAGDPWNNFTKYLHGDGHANEDYDAVDYQNVLLAALMQNGNVPIPSLHRPELINYWYHRLVNEWLVPVVGVSDPADAWRAVLQPVIAAQKGIINAQTRDAIVALKRRISFRPLAELHNAFTGSNPQWAAWSQVDIFDTSQFPDVASLRDVYWLTNGVPLNGPWDVDCNGDGIRDSIWVDLGFPVGTMPDGRRYKPLFAILCVDLDGRLNLNAHGCLAQTLQDSSGLSLYRTNQTPVYAAPSLFADGSPQARLPRAQGYGPPEVNLEPVLGSLKDYRHLLMGRGVTHPVSGVVRWVDGRYGEACGPDADGDGLPDDFRNVAPGESFGPLDGLSNNDRDNPQMLLAFDPLARNKFFDFAGLGSSYSLGIPCAFGTPPDLKGSMAIGLDVRGQPMYWPMVDPAVNSLAGGFPDRFAWSAVNSPYELNLAGGATRTPDTTASVRSGYRSSRIDHPFSVYEFEKLQRRFDLDGGGLADRLELLAPSLVAHRHEVTTESWDVPCPQLNYLRDPASGSQPLRFTHFTELLRAKLRNPALPTPQVRDRPDLWPSLVPRELLAGLKMNLNRPFGNGLDDNNNGVVDDVAEVFDPTAPGDPSRWEMLTLATPSGSPIQVPMDHSNGVDVDGNGNDANGNNTVDAPDDLALIAIDHAQARQLYARYLYILAILLSGDEIYDAPNDLKSNWDAERLAQWAVNVVDFIDRDSIMTPFPFDRDPLNGWNPADTTDNPDFPNNVVWGCERPELLLTESFGFHDVRTRDTSADPSGKRTDDADNPDLDFDSVRPPEGSLFLELYNPWTSAEHLPGEFCFDRSTGTWSPGVRLNQTTPNGDPVFRVLIAMPEGNPSEQTFQPRDPDVPVLAPATVERSVYFVRPSGNYGDGAAIRYYPTNQNIAPVMPGRYAVIGPGASTGRGTTFMGYQTADTDWSGTPAAERPRRIVLTQNTDPNTQQVAVYASDINNPDSVPAKPAVAVVIDQVTDPQDGTNRRSPRFSVSEPANGYTMLDPNGQALDANGNFVTPWDDPLDETTDPALWESSFPDGDTKGIRYHGTNRRFRVAYLQRLANPLLPWDATMNPYRTIDAMHIDLTVFNGMTGDQDPEVQPAQHDEFFTVQRGASMHTSTPPGYRPAYVPPVGDDQQRNNIWAAEPEPALAPATPTPPRDVYPPPVPHFYNETFAHTLGRLNAWYGAPRPAGGPDPGGIYLGDSLDTAAADDGPWPWLTWLNRPFVNEMELLQVPGERSSQLLRRMSAGLETSSDPYHPTDYDPANPNAGEPLSFPHLGSFFGTPQPIDPMGRPRASRLDRLLEFVHVPSRFVGMELQANPEKTASWGLVPPDPLVGAPFGFSFRPPYNGISCYREPGRVNLNTIFSQNVWTGLLDYFPIMAGTATDYWNEMVASRRGYVPTSGNLNENVPTQFANPFRSSAGADLLPLATIQTGIFGANKEGIHATVLRGDAASPPHGGPTERPLFKHESTDAFENTARNPYFRHQLLQRLAGVATTRSNVYAVWITVGYFEVQPATIPNPAVYPDGYQLGPELGSDTGEIKRHRAFYIFDRSIPVGFERGKDHNVSDAILLERFIE